METYTRPEEVQERPYEDKEREEQTNPFKEWAQDFNNKINKVTLPF